MDTFLNFYYCSLTNLTESFGQTIKKKTEERSLKEV